MPITDFSLDKEERICSKKLIEELFNGGESRSVSAYPIRVVYLHRKAKSEENSSVSILVSVPKRCFKRAVKRNRVKRQIREAYRRNKSLVKEQACSERFFLALSFIWLDNKLYPSVEVEKKMKSLLERIVDSL